MFKIKLDAVTRPCINGMREWDRQELIINGDTVTAWGTEKKLYMELERYDRKHWYSVDRKLVSSMPKEWKYSYKKGGIDGVSL